MVDRLTPGQLRSRRMLGSEATYRVIGLDGPNAVVEVVDVPGLQTGLRLRLAADCVAAMEVVDFRAARDAELAELLGAPLAA